jgi:hypothetical protein
VKSQIVIGQIFGYRKVLERVPPPIGIKYPEHSFWLVECSCGEKSIVRGGNLKRSSTCKKCVNVLKRKTKGECSFNGLYLRYKHGALDRDIEFDLTKEEFRDFTKEDCFYCGQTPKQIHKGKTAFGEYVYSGIDRVDCNSGYSIVNCVSCCEICNRAKNDASSKDFNQWITQLVNFRIGNGR